MKTTAVTLLCVLFISSICSGITRNEESRQSLNISAASESRDGFSFHSQQQSRPPHAEQGLNLTTDESKHRILSSSSSTSKCTLSSCNGIDLQAAIKRDFKPWHDKGGITARDIDAAEKALHKVEGYIRVSIIGGQLYASHLGRSWGTRDGVFLVSILEMLRTDPSSLPDQVEFVLSTMDRTQIGSGQRSKESIPFALGFATAPGFLEVPIPDPSFWSWPEMLIPPYWEIINDPKVVPWKDKPMRAFWRGGTARNSGVREVLIHCGKNSRHRGKGVTFDMKNAVRNWPKTWAGPMDTCQYKLAVFAQGYGYTSAKERNLACGSVPIFVEHDNVDTYFGRWLKEGVHFKRLRAGPAEDMCSDLDDAIDWVLKDDAGAERMGKAARQFAESVLQKGMLNGYVAAVLREAAALQHHTPSTRGMEKLHHRNIADRFDAASRAAGAEKGATKDGQKGGPVEAAIAALQGKPCPQERCPKCCFRSPKAVAAEGQDVEAEASEGSWWRRHKNGQFAFWKVQRCKDDPDPRACTAALTSASEDAAAGNGEGGSATLAGAPADEDAAAPSSSGRRSHSSSSSPSASRLQKSSPDLIKLMAKKKHVSAKLGGGGASSPSSSSSGDVASPPAMSSSGAKAYWKLKLEKQRQSKEGS